MSPDTAAIVIIAALPWADRLADKIMADRRARRAHEAAMAKEARQP